MEFKFEECKSCEYHGNTKLCSKCVRANRYSELWNCDPNCHHEIKGGNGIRCIKCGGWFCY